MSPSISFCKYSGTGNDFIIFDNRTLQLDKSDAHFITKLCARRIGIGADGLLLLENANPSSQADYKMVYFNSDGGEASMCGNGARCLLHFAHYELGLKKSENSYTFETQNGLYRGEILENGHIAILMSEISDDNQVHLDLLKQQYPHFEDFFFINTGVPHLVVQVEDVSKIDIKKIGKELRFHPIFGKDGANINFVQINNQNNKNELHLRTYERGVEDETLACGTGATAAALFYWKKIKSSATVHIHVKGGELFLEKESSSSHVWLKGNVDLIFRGMI